MRRYLNFGEVNPTINLILTFAAAAGLVFFSMPTLIRVAHLKRLLDEPEGERKLHSRAVPTIGGVAVYFGLMAAVSLFLPRAFESAEDGQQWGAALTALLILFFIGLKDDLVGLSPSKKLLVHMLLGGLLIFEGGFRITTFDGLFGLEALPFFVSCGFSLFVYIVVVNALNLIDGVDGLAGGFGALAAGAFGLLFAASGQITSATLALALCGSLLGFLRYNWTPASIFLGDAGSLMAGMLAYLFAVQWINLPHTAIPEFLGDMSTPLVAMTLLAYPLVDTLRVFTLRVLRGRSPFSPDRNHLHHRMMALGWGHRRTSLTVYGYTLLMWAVAWGLDRWLEWDETVVFLVVLVLAFAFFAPILRKSTAIKARRLERVQQHRHQANRGDAGTASFTEI